LATRGIRCERSDNEFNDRTNTVEVLVTSTRLSSQGLNLQRVAIAW
jgi:hypothetical protein